MDSVSMEFWRNNAVILKPRVAFVGLGVFGKRLIARLGGVEGFSVFLHSERFTVPNDGAMEWQFSKIDPQSPDSPTPIDLSEELSLADIVFAIDYYREDKIDNWPLAKLVELARDCGVIPIKCHIPIPPMFANTALFEIIKERFSVADEALMQYARDTYAERGLLSHYEKYTVNKASELLVEREKND